MQRDLVKLVLWRAWTTHNNITHQSGPTGIQDGVQALLSMRSMLEQLEQGNDHSLKGKETCCSRSANNRKGKESIAGKHERWRAPPEGWCKINVDGSFLAENGTAGLGVVARDATGKVLLTVWRVLFRCADAAEAEA